MKFLRMSLRPLNTLGLRADALTRADLVDLNLVEGSLGEGVEVLRSNGQLVGIQLPGAGAFGLPGAGPVRLPGGVTLPALPARWCERNTRQTLAIRKIISIYTRTYALTN